MAGWVGGATNSPNNRQPGSRRCDSGILSYAPTTVLQRGRRQQCLTRPIIRAVARSIVSRRASGVR
jgi:hypothetical protein